MVRWGTPIHFLQISQLPCNLGHITYHVINSLPAEQRKSRGCYQVHKETCISGLARQTNQLGNSHKPCCSTGTHFTDMMRPISGSEIIWAPCTRQLTSSPTFIYKRVAKVIRRSRQEGKGYSWKYRIIFNKNKQRLPNLNIGNHVTVQNPVSKLWDIYGIVTAMASHGHYVVDTQCGHVLVRNHCFLHKQTPVSI